MDEQSLLNTDKAASWQLKALTEALDNLTLTISDSLSVGRGSDNDVVLGSKEVSRNHALLSILNDELYVKDLASSNGTFVNNERIESNQSKLLQLNDSLSFASFSFAVIAPIADAVIASDSETVSDTQDDIERLSAGITSRPVTNDVNNSIADAVNDPLNNEDLTVADSIVSDPVVSHSIPSAEQQPVVKQTIIKEVLTASDTIIPTSAAAMPIAADKIIEPATPTSNETISTLSTEIEQEPVIASTIPKPPVVEEIPVTEPVAIESSINESSITAPVTDEPLIREKASHQESVVSPEHDKTTTTALQEEADPDIMRAKQAATGQFSGTANLGAGRDLGTEGNNAMDQALTNTANAGQADKKPSGSWFIWVFIVLIIIGLALWLFNMGGA